MGGGLLLRVLVRNKGDLNASEFSRFRTKWVDQGMFWEKSLVNLIALWKCNVVLLELINIFNIHLNN